MTPAAVHFGRAPELHATRGHVLEAAYAAHPERFVRKPPVPTGVADRRLDQQARDEGDRSLNSDTKRLTELDRLRSGKPSNLIKRPSPKFPVNRVG